MPSGEKLFRFLGSLTLRRFYGTVTIRLDSGKVTHATAETKRTCQYKDLPVETKTGA